MCSPRRARRGSRTSTAGRCPSACRSRPARTGGSRCTCRGGARGLSWGRSIAERRRRASPGLVGLVLSDSELDPALAGGGPFRFADGQALLLDPLGFHYSLSGGGQPRFHELLDLGLGHGLAVAQELELIVRCRGQLLAGQPHREVAANGHDLLADAPLLG